MTFCVSNDWYVRANVSSKVILLNGPIQLALLNTSWKFSKKKVIANSQLHSSPIPTKHQAYFSKIYKTNIVTTDTLASIRWTTMTWRKSLSTIADTRSIIFWTRFVLTIPSNPSMAARNFDHVAKNWAILYWSAKRPSPELPFFLKC